MDQYPDWVSMINLNLSDHEARLQMIETAIKAGDVDLDDDDHGWAGDTLRQVQQYDLRTSSDRQAARMDNHDQRLRAIEHRLLLIEVEIRELDSAITAAGSLNATRLRWTCAGWRVQRVRPVAACVRCRA